MRPMLATPAAALPSGPDWAHEVKWDGMRLLVDIHDGRLTLSSRNGNDVTASFPELAGLAHTYADVLLDGEVVALEDGLPSFAALAERMHVKDPRKAQRLAARRPVTLMVFDVLRLFGQDVTGLPWTGRRDLLERLDLRGPSWQVPQAYADGAQLLEATLEQGLEGIVSKRRAAAYAEGRRSPDWRKMSHRLTLSAVIGGWRAEIGNDARLGAVLLGLPHPHGWAYAGRMGSGLAGPSRHARCGLARPRDPAHRTVFRRGPGAGLPRDNVGGTDDRRRGAGARYNRDGPVAPSDVSWGAQRPDGCGPRRGPGHEGGEPRWLNLGR